MISSKKQSGSAIVEFAIVASVFFSTIITSIDLAYFGYVKLTMQNAVREGARYAITGRSDLDPDSEGSREAAILEKISSSSHGFLERVMDVENIRVEDVYGNSVAGFGGSGDMIAIHLDCEWPTASLLVYPFLQDGKYEFTVSAAMRNESF
ncbi:pilus assembly protein [Vibrio profundum]|uniref:TadE/TadG family type IV pilus assembly protein n=1 Tax=Vibrio profundum TaxID=2910247 RepID=UPI003D0F3600